MLHIGGSPGLGQVRGGVYPAEGSGSCTAVHVYSFAARIADTLSQAVTLGGHSGHRVGASHSGVPLAIPHWGQASYTTHYIYFVNNLQQSIGGA